jgi:arylformamidase
MPIYDVTVPLHNGLPTWPGDPGIEIHDCQSLANGDGANVSLLHFGAHTATHVDAPAHFIEGAAKVEALPLDALIGEAEVIEVSEDRLVIDEEFIGANFKSGVKRILFKTRNSAFWNEPKLKFHTDFTYLDLNAATKLVHEGIRLVGIDYLSIEKFGQASHETHVALLSGGVIILEGVNLSNVPAGKYELICLPLRLRSNLGDGAPARVVLRTLDGR